MTTVDSSSTARATGVTTVLRDLVLLVARVGLGVVTIAHAEVEYDYGGSLGGVVDAFGQSGVPLPAITGPANLFGELIGGALLILGFGVPVIGALMAVNMVGAWIFVHTSARADPPRPVRPLPPAHRRRPHRDATPPNPASLHRLEPRAAA